MVAGAGALGARRRAQDVRDPEEFRSTVCCGCMHVAKQQTAQWKPMFLVLYFKRMRRKQKAQGKAEGQMRGYIMWPWQLDHRCPVSS